MIACHQPLMMPSVISHTQGSGGISCPSTHPNTSATPEIPAHKSKHLADLHPSSFLVCQICVQNGYLKVKSLQALIKSGNHLIPCLAQPKVFSNLLSKIQTAWSAVPAELAGLTTPEITGRPVKNDLLSTISLFFFIPPLQVGGGEVEKL